MRYNNFEVTYVWVDCKRIRDATFFLPFFVSLLHAQYVGIVGGAQVHRGALTPLVLRLVGLREKCGMTGWSALVCRGPRQAVTLNRPN